MYDSWWGIRLATSYNCYSFDYVNKSRISPFNLPSSSVFMLIMIILNSWYQKHLTFDLKTFEVIYIISFYNLNLISINRTSKLLNFTLSKNIANLIFKYARQTQLFSLCVAYYDSKTIKTTINWYFPSVSRIKITRPEKSITPNKELFLRNKTIFNCSFNWRKWIE